MSGEIKNYSLAKARKRKEMLPAKERRRKGYNLPCRRWYFIFVSTIGDGIAFYNYWIIIQ